MSHFKERYSIVQNKIGEAAHSCQRLDSDVKLIVVTKYQPIEAILEAYQAGCRSFGESRVQEAEEKIPCLPEDCDWHLIGSLQKNKVGKALSLFNVIHSVDSLSLAKKISDQNGKIHILLEVNVTGEESKHGLSPEEWERTIEKLNELSHLQVIGLMTMAPFTQDEKVIRSCFRKLYELQQKWKGEVRAPDLFTELSMGMSNDYTIAVQEGATMLRIGSALFK
jgi:PLP dependent protein